MPGSKFIREEKKAEGQRVRSGGKDCWGGAILPEENVMELDNDAQRDLLFSRAILT